MNQTGVAVTWTFHGRVLPDAPAVTLSLPDHRALSSLGFSYELRGEISNSKVLAIVRQLDEVDILTLRNAVALDVQSSLDLVGFLVGAGLEVDLISAQADDGAWQFFDAFVPFLKRIGEVQVPSALIAKVAEDTPAQIALADFRQAIRVPVQTGFYCYRAIETLMQVFRDDPKGKEAQAWEALRKQLAVSRDAIDRIKVHADWARHGRAGQVTDDDRIMLLQATREIVDRYLEYTLTGRLDRELYTGPR